MTLEELFIICSDYKALENKTIKQLWNIYGDKSMEESSQKDIFMIKKFIENLPHEIEDKEDLLNLLDKYNYKKDQLNYEAR